MYATYSSLTRCEHMNWVSYELGIIVRNSSFSPTCSVSGFEFTSETGIFDLVGVPLYHGWLVEPQNPCCQVVKDLSYNQLAEKVIKDGASQDSKLLQEGT